eukprot:1447995-Amphidinium_carterae.1
MEGHCDYCSATARRLNATTANQNRQASTPTSHTPTAKQTTAQDKTDTHEEDAILQGPTSKNHEAPPIQSDGAHRPPLSTQSPTTTLTPTSHPSRTIE